MSKKQLEKIEVICDVCKLSKTISRGTHEANLKRNGFYRCAKCSPQRTKAFWENKERKQSHSETMRSSGAYYKALKTRDTAGSKNGMFGKNHSTQTIAKMSKSRTGKIGKNATAWKGGKSSFTSRIKKAIHVRYNWFMGVISRDGFKCRSCGVLASQAKLDAHHIEPVVNIIRRITEDQSFENDNAKFEWILLHPDIQDFNLHNGITLCRQCHQKEHNNWGSHVRP